MEVSGHWGSWSVCVCVCERVCVCLCVCVLQHVTVEGPACLHCCCSYCKAVVTGIVMGSLHTMDGECKGITAHTHTFTRTHTHTHTEIHSCTCGMEHFLVQLPYASSILHGNVNIPTTYGTRWTGGMGSLAHMHAHKKNKKNTHTLSITVTNPAFLLIPSPPAVKTSPPSNPQRSAPVLSLCRISEKRTCRSLVCADLWCECSLTGCSAESTYFLRPLRKLNLCKGQALHLFEQY